MALDKETRFEDLYERYHQNVRAYCARRAGGDMQDLVAEVFLVAWRRIDQVPNGHDALFWLYGVAFRMLNRRWRTHTRRRRALERLGRIVDADLAAATDVVVVQRDEYRLVREAASRLRTVDQEILRLTLWEELSHVEVADVLDIDVDAVKQPAHRARRRLDDEYRRLMRDHANPDCSERRCRDDHRRSGCGTIRCSEPTTHRDGGRRRSGGQRRRRRSNFRKEQKDGHCQDRTTRR